VKRQDFELEKFLISKAVGPALHSFDFVVGPLQVTGRVGVIIIGQETTAMESQSHRETQGERDAGGLGSGNPAFQEGDRRGSVRLFPEWRIGNKNRHRKKATRMNSTIEVESRKPGGTTWLRLPGQDREI
jgi:hypothetical protein